MTKIILLPHIFVPWLNSFFFFFPLTFKHFHSILSSFFFFGNCRISFETALPTDTPGMPIALTAVVQGEKTHPKAQLLSGLRRWILRRFCSDLGFERAAEPSQGGRRWAAKLCSPSRFISAWKATSAAPGELCWLRLPEGPGGFQLELAAAF